MQNIFPFLIGSNPLVNLALTKFGKQLQNTENDVNNTEYMPEKGRVSEKLWGQGCDCGTFRAFYTFRKKEIDNLLSENKAKTERTQLDR